MNVIIKRGGKMLKGKNVCFKKEKDKISGKTLKENGLL
jgi:hypothetical protein